MSLIVLAVYDNAAQTFGHPFFEKAVGLGVRGFEDACKREEDNNPLFKHPLDFSLWQVGIFDEVTGEFDRDFSRIKLCDAVVFQKE